MKCYVRWSQNDFFKLTFLSKNKQMNSTLLLWYLRSICLCSFFRRNWRHQKDISKLTDLQRKTKVATKIEKLKNATYLHSVFVIHFYENLITQPYLFVVSFSSSRVGSLKRPDPIILISIFFYLLVAIISSRWNSHIIFQNWEIYQLDTYQTFGRHSLILA